ncbi:hypothetical protein VP277E431_P0156 [Vibrio phage 277E43-1]|nr:hypothetical protein VP277E431_P0156 [Vibrio phage 277E43-1]
MLRVDICDRLWYFHIVMYHIFHCLLFYIEDL